MILTSRKRHSKEARMSTIIFTFILFQVFKIDLSVKFRKRVEGKFCSYQHPIYWRMFTRERKKKKILIFTFNRKEWEEQNRRKYLRRREILKTIKEIVCKFISVVLHFTCLPSFLPFLPLLTSFFLSFSLSFLSFSISLPHHPSFIFDLPLATK